MWYVTHKIFSETKLPYTRSDISVPDAKISHESLPHANQGLLDVKINIMFLSPLTTFYGHCTNKSMLGNTPLKKEI